MKPRTVDWIVWTLFSFAVAALWLWLSPAEAAATVPFR
jgi:hypothetical protein